jgi:hypothetical protein
VGVAVAILAGNSTEGTQSSVTLTRFMETAFGPNGLADAEFTPTLDERPESS